MPRAVAKQLFAIILLAYLTGCAELKRSAVTGRDRVNVFFATTRQYDPHAPANKAFSNSGTKREWITFGTAEVTVPLPHSEGVQKGIAVEKIDIPPGDQQHQFRVLTAEQTGNPKRPLVVFVHGFNNTFETAAERAALFAHDLQPDVARDAAIFSWPSGERLLGYFHDEDMVLVNQDRTRQVLEILRTHDSASPVVLIGHSMGGRVLTVALREIELIRDKGKTPKLGHPEFAHLILIEPDVNSEYFRENIARVRAICGHVTVYASNHDNALKFSELLHDSEREGQFAGQGLSQRIDVIDASAARTNWIGHATMAPNFSKTSERYCAGTLSTNGTAKLWLRSRRESMRSGVSVSFTPNSTPTNHPSCRHNVPKSRMERADRAT